MGERIGVLTELLLTTRLFDTVLLVQQVPVFRNITVPSTWPRRHRLHFYFRKFWNSLRLSKTWYLQNRRNLFWNLFFVCVWCVCVCVYMVCVCVWRGAVLLSPVQYVALIAMRILRPATVLIKISLSTLLSTLWSSRFVCVYAKPVILSTPAFFCWRHSGRIMLETCKIKKLLWVIRKGTVRMWQRTLFFHSKDQSLNAV